jgi:predicted RNA-binding Zn-ribbon protein involved in translation (DUF1610 family)
MPMLYVKCPSTARDAPTGFDISKGTKLTVFKKNKFKCPHCGSVHIWDGRDAFFMDDGKK